MTSQSLHVLEQHMDQSTSINPSEPKHEDVVDESIHPHFLTRHVQDDAELQHIEDDKSINPHLRTTTYSNLCHTDDHYGTKLTKKNPLHLLWGHS